MMFRHSLGRPDVAGAIEQGVSVALEAHYLTPDLGGGKTTEEVTEAVSKWVAAGEGVI
jgi:3-isopropylmalate dehydrogenase